ncbi:MAG TPA: 8-amino-7-oxononanoate synthase [bacterium]|jgi:8-amino-7-oxononanoate synthase|nr:8-amino-7-oxononanoate synthase [bacterium]
MAWWSELESGLAAAEAEGQRRHLRTVDTASAPVVRIGGKTLVQFASNNYLGLATHPRVVAASQAAAERWGTGSGSSPLVAGHQGIHAELEAALAKSKGAESALVYAAGSLANLGCMGALPGEDGQVFLDKLDHATLYDGARLSGAAVDRFPHQDLNRLAAQMKRSRAAGTHRIVVAVDAVYSMDGDVAPLPQLLELAQRYDAVLVVDEAHSTAVLGANGHGILEHFKVKAWPACLVLTGTLSKALGSLGGYVAGPKVLVEHLVNRSRGYIFATSLAAPAAAAALEAMRVVEDEPGHLAQLRTNSAVLAQGLDALGWGPQDAVTPIFPVVVGPSDAAVALQARLWDQGFFVPAIRPPTVPAAACRLRLSVTAAHSEDQLRAVLAALGPKP